MYGRRVLVPDGGDLVERTEGPMVFFELGSHKRRCLLCDLCVGPAGCPSRPPAMSWKWGLPVSALRRSFLTLRSIVVTVGAAAVSSAGLWFSLAWTVAAATGGLPDLTISSPPLVLPSLKASLVPARMGTESSCPTPLCSVA